MVFTVEAVCSIELYHSQLPFVILRSLLSITNLLLKSLIENIENKWPKFKRAFLSRQLEPTSTSRHGHSHSHSQDD